MFEKKVLVLFFRDNGMPQKKACEERLGKHFKKYAWLDEKDNKKNEKKNKKEPLRT